MRFSILTLFPEMFTGVLGHSILARGIQKNSLRVDLVPLREFARDRHRTVDDAPFGGGPGMVIKPDVLERALLGIDDWQKTHRVTLSPQGKPFCQQDAMRLAGYPHVVLVCGHYEGIDERFVEQYVNEEISLGDFVMTGGEIAAMAIVDATARLLPGVLGDAESYQNDSFFHGLLDHPHYTRPATWKTDRGGVTQVPEVLLSGHHDNVQQWRRRQSWLRTWLKRPDLLGEAPLTKEEKRLLKALQHDWKQDNDGMEG